MGDQGGAGAGQGSLVGVVGLNQMRGGAAGEDEEGGMQNNVGDLRT